MLAKHALYFHGALTDKVILIIGHNVDYRDTVR